MRAEIAEKIQTRADVGSLAMTLAEKPSATKGHEGISPEIVPAWDFASLVVLICRGLVWPLLESAA